MYRLSRDVCFLDLTETPKRYDIIRIMRDYPNVTLLRAFTKSCVMAGVRLGYTLCGDRDFLVEMSRCASCWNVSTLASDSGVFAQLYGTVELLEPDERARVKATVINKFRGDVSILQSGLDMLYDLVKIPYAGVVPYVRVDIDDEDSLSEPADVGRAARHRHRGVPVFGICGGLQMLGRTISDPYETEGGGDNTRALRKARNQL